VVQCVYCHSGQIMSVSANAIFAATDKRLRRLPSDTDSLRSSS
jgi:aerobic-type carbon monoxide dehydrogenase small subunit (CoxS/CutS family)